MTDQPTVLFPEGYAPTASTSEPFRFNVTPGGRLYELPALDSKDIPLPLIPIVLAVGSQYSTDSLDDVERIRIAGTFVAFIQQDHPRLWHELKRHGIEGILALITKWAEHSRLDPSRPASGA